MSHRITVTRTGATPAYLVKLDGPDGTTDQTRHAWTNDDVQNLIPELGMRQVGPWRKDDDGRDFCPVVPA